MGKKNKNKKVSLNKDGIPTNTCLFCEVNDGTWLLIVGKDGRYYIDTGPVDSLEEATNRMTDFPTDWKTFWKTHDGVTVEQLIEQEKQ